MTYEIPENTSALIEQTTETIHDDLATEHGRDNVLIVVDGEGKIHIEIEDGVGAF